MSTPPCPHWPCPSVRVIEKLIAVTDEDVFGPYPRTEPAESGIEGSHE